MGIKEKIDQTADILAEARYVSVLTGAGISTPSGIPDFRSFESGLWERVDPFQVATIYAFRQNPQVFFDWVQPLAHTVLNAEPNPAHYALAELEEMGVVKELITQNIDGLHQRANSRLVHEVHGHMREATCIRCYAGAPTTPMIHVFLENGRLPRCEKCDGVMKPNVILFGEQLPARAMIAAQQSARKSDVMLIAGSSLTIAPAGDLPILTKERNGKLIIVNLSSTFLDRMADVVIHADVVEVLPELVRAIRARTHE
jgi:NAD-dependent deacetylase